MPTKPAAVATAGFTLIEVIFSLLFVTILSAIGFASLSTLRPQADISTTSNQIVAILQLARNRTQASENDTTYGVHFENDRFVLFTGSTYDALASDNEVHLLEPGVEIHDISIGGGSDVIFDRVTGTTSNSGEIGIRLTNDTANTRTISILSSGLIGFTGTVSPTDTRITDSRHVHFNLGWSIQGATTLTLTFSDPPNADVVESITMDPYFNADQTNFDWSGTIDVNGSNQTMRIHTHALDAVNTELSITRDGRHNDKAVLVTIDSNDIVSYDSAGAATVQSSGGTMTIQ